MKNPTGQVARWIERLAAFDWEILHRAGRLHGNADALSRRFCEGDCAQCLKMIPGSDPELQKERKLLDDLQEQLITINRIKKADGKGKANKVPAPTRKQARAQKDGEVLKTFQGMWDRAKLLLAVTKDPLLSILLSWDDKRKWEEMALRCQGTADQRN